MGDGERVSRANFSEFFPPGGQGFGGSECRLYDAEGLCVIQNPLPPLGGGGGKIYGFEFLGKFNTRKRRRK